MSIISIAVMVVIVTIFATITLASLSYGAFKLRERRSPALSPEHSGPEFFERVRLSTDVRSAA